jgi:quercetin dioxygenase-like cupin family protein
MARFFRLISILLVISSCNDSNRVSLEILHKSSESWDGIMIEYPDGNEEITAVRIKLAPNAKLPFHCHPYPTIGYVISGKIEVEKEDGESKQFAKGDVVFELVNSWHRGRNLSQFKQAEIVAFYIGQKNFSNTILKDIQYKHECIKS